MTSFPVKFSISRCWKNYNIKILAWTSRLKKIFGICTLRLHLTSSIKNSTFRFSNSKTLQKSSKIKELEVQKFTPRLIEVCSRSFWIQMCENPWPNGAFQCWSPYIIILQFKNNPGKSYQFFIVKHPGKNAPFVLYFIWKKTFQYSWRIFSITAYRDDMVKIKNYLRYIKGVMWSSQGFWWSRYRIYKQWFAKDWHILCVRKTRKMCQSLACQISTVFPVILVDKLTFYNREQ